MDPGGGAAVTFLLFLLAVALCAVSIICVFVAAMAHQSMTHLVRMDERLGHVESGGTLPAPLLPSRDPASPTVQFPAPGSAADMAARLGQLAAEDREVPLPP